jgi:hypothetical protein
MRVSEMSRAVGMFYKQGVVDRKRDAPFVAKEFVTQKK